MDDWNEIKTAAAVARHGTIAAAASDLGVHRATVNRHVEHLETVFGMKLFQRHNRGMTPTELGRKLLRVADATQSQFGQLLREAKSDHENLTGDFTVTSLDVLAPWVMPLVAQFRMRHPGLNVRYVSSDRVLRLAYGEADVAFRVGAEPTDLDNVVQAFATLAMGIYGHRDLLGDDETLPGIEHLMGMPWVGPDPETPNAPFVAWLREQDPKNQFAFRSPSIAAMWHAVIAGIGIGFLPTRLGDVQRDLVQLAEPKPDWDEQIWMVTHVDLHRSAKVQAFVRALKDPP